MGTLSNSVCRDKGLVTRSSETIGRNHTHGLRNLRQSVFRLPSSSPCCRDYPIRLVVGSVAYKDKMSIGLDSV
jgi:hypothetical protein